MPTSKAEFEYLAVRRIEEAKQLFAAGSWDGAYYLARYAIEFAFKAILCKQFQAEVMPDMTFMNKMHRHDPAGLLATCELGADLKAETTARQGYWLTVVEWNEQTRYARKTQADAQSLIEADRRRKERDIRMATIQMVNRLNERQGLRLAEKLEGDSTVSAVFWWAHIEDPMPLLVVGFSTYHEEGALNCIRRLQEAVGDWSSSEAPDILQLSVVGEDDPRVQRLLAQPWHVATLDSPDLTYRLLNTYSRASGTAQALVYFLRAGDEVRVPLPPALSQVA